jgi:hypothetical protein
MSFPRNYTLLEDAIREVRHHCMSELKFFLLIGVLTQDFNTVDLVKFFEKNQKLHIQIVAITLKVT